MTYKTDTSLASSTIGEILANSITHGIGVGLSIAGLVLLIIRAVKLGTGWHLAGFLVFGISLILLYSSSTIYHSFANKSWIGILQRLDHVAIYFLIAGTYTPFLLISLRGAWGWTLLFIVWGLAILGVGFKALFIHRFQKLSVLAYILMGWLSVVAIKEFMANIPRGGLILLGVGGVVYTAGVIFYGLKRIRYNHAIWHVFVMGGSICHYFAVLLYLAPVR